MLQLKKSCISKKKLCLGNSDRKNCRKTINKTNK